MRIAFLAYLHGFGGAEKQIIMLANAMAERGHDVWLVVINEDNCCFEIDSKVKHVFLKDKASGGLCILTRYLSIRKQLSEIAPDITVHFWYQSVYLTALMKKSITGKIIYSERGDPSDKEYQGMLGLVRKWTLPRIDWFVFQSKGARDFFDAEVRKRSDVIANPIPENLSEYPNVSYRRKVIVNVGRLNPQKNQKLLINAFGAIAERFPDYSLKIFGEGPLKDTLQNQINTMGLSDRVFLMGNSNKIHDAIYDASLFVLSSDYEGLPNALLEAMALGIPCISADCRPGGAREIIDNNISGLIVPTENKDKMAEAMARVLDDHDLASALSRNARQISKSYLPQIIYDKWDSVMRKFE